MTLSYLHVMEFKMFNLFKICISLNHNLLNLKHKYMLQLVTSLYQYSVKYSPCDGINTITFLILISAYDFLLEISAYFQSDDLDVFE